MNSLQGAEYATKLVRRYPTIVIIPPSLCLLDHHLRCILRVHYLAPRLCYFFSPDDLLAVVLTISRHTSDDTHVSISSLYVIPFLNT